MPEVLPPQGFALPGHHVCSQQRQTEMGSPCLFLASLVRPATSVHANAPSLSRNRWRCSLCHTSHLQGATCTVCCGQTTLLHQAICRHLDAWELGSQNSVPVGSRVPLLLPPLGGGGPGCWRLYELPLDPLTPRFAAAACQGHGHVAAAAGCDGARHLQVMNAVDQRCH